MVPIEKVIEALNHREALRAAWTRLPYAVSYVLPTHSQCAAKVAADEATELEQFIYNNEPAGLSDDNWRAHLADVLAETVLEDRWSCMPEKINAE